MLCMFCMLFRPGENIVLYVIIILIGKVRTLIVGVFCLVLAVLAKVQASAVHGRKFPRKIHTKTGNLSGVKLTSVANTF
jgi:hypothetical protein